MDYPPNFSRQELLRSDTANKRGIKNVPNAKEEANLLNTAWFLQELRENLKRHYGKDVPLKINSGFRGEKLNAAVGGSQTSAHRLGYAADVVPIGITVAELANFTAVFMKGYDQVIYEFGRWVHIGLADKPREQFLSAEKVNGRTVYSRIKLAGK